MDKKFVISVVAIFILSMATGFIVHGYLLHDDYAQLPGLFRTEMEGAGYFGWMIMANALIALGFVWIYRRGRENRPFLAQGLRFGLAIAVLMTIPMYLIYYAVQPMPGAVVLKQIVFDTIGVLLMGAVVAWIHK